ncbi:MAG TPA: Maf family nucleotide pyrophosphatase [Bacteroidales bacterium]|nr:Maf family nucleotide pyrophosphatase [Bacteroidales bacterium]
MIIDKLNSHRIILASRSPRRQQLLREMGLRFDVVIREFDESYPGHLSGSEIAEYISSRKAQSFKNEISSGEIVITADTVVWCDKQVLGKPVDLEDAVRMLNEISGNTHEVITGVSLIAKGKEVTFSESTKVTFEEMNPEEIRYYAEKYRPFDKAGAYGIQEWIGIIACSHIDGSYFNVVGLPVQRLYAELKKIVNE